MEYRGKRWSRERVEAYLAKYMPGFIIYDQEWEPENQYSKAPLRCPKGHDFERRCGHIRKRLGCPVCKDEERRLKHGRKFYDAVTAEGYIPKFKPEDYVNSHQKLLTICPNGEEYQTSKTRFIDMGSRCACDVCNPRKGMKYKRRTHEEAYVEMLAIGERLLGRFKGVDVPVLSECLKCGNRRKIRPNNYLRGRATCDKCAGRYSPTDEEYNERIAPLGFRLAPGATYINSYTPIPHICEKGHHTMKRPNDVLEGKGCSECAREKQSERLRGRNPNTGEELPPERKKELEEARQSPEYHAWRRQVLERDNHRCILCESTIDVEAHHLYSFTNYEDLRYLSENGVALCKTHHRQEIGSFHAVHGQDGSTVASQFIDYLDEYMAHNPYADKDRLLRLKRRVEALIEYVEGPKVVKYEQLTLWRKEAEAHAI